MLEIKYVFDLKAVIFIGVPRLISFDQADREDPGKYSWVDLQGIKAEEYVKRSRIYQDLVCSIASDSESIQIFSTFQS